jgi:hypothetical protein
MDELLVPYWRVSPFQMLTLRVPVPHRQNAAKTRPTVLERNQIKSGDQMGLRSCFMDSPNPKVSQELTRSRAPISTA